MGTITGNGTAQTGLGGAAGYGETALPRNDDGTSQADVSAVFEDGFLLNGVTCDASELFISTDGFVTFMAPYWAGALTPEGQAPRCTAPQAQVARIC